MQLILQLNIPNLFHHTYEIYIYYNYLRLIGPVGIGVLIKYQWEKGAKILQKITTPFTVFVLLFNLSVCQQDFLFSYIGYIKFQRLMLVLELILNYNNFLSQVGIYAYWTCFALMTALMVAAGFLIAFFGFGFGALFAWIFR